MEDELKEIKNSLDKLPEEEKKRVIRDIKRLISMRGKKKRPFGAIGFAADTNTTPVTQPLPSPLGEDTSDATFTVTRTSSTSTEQIPTGGTATVEGPPESETTVEVTATGGGVSVTVAS